MGFSPFNGRSKPPSGANLKNTHEQAHPTEQQEHPMPKLLPFPQTKLHNDRLNGFLQQSLHAPTMNSVSHVMEVVVHVLPLRHGLKQPFGGDQAAPDFRSGRVDLELQLIEGAQRAAAGTGGAAVRVAGAGGVVVVALERVGSAGHWTRKTRAVDPLGVRDPIGSVVTHSSTDWIQRISPLELENTEFVVVVVLVPQYSLSVSLILRVRNP